MSKKSDFWKCKDLNQTPGQISEIGLEILDDIVKGAWFLIVFNKDFKRKIHFFYLIIWYLKLMVKICIIKFH